MESEVRRLPVAKALAIYLVVAFGVAYAIEFKVAELFLHGTAGPLTLFVLAGAMYAPTLASFTALLLSGFRLRECVRFLGISKFKLRWAGYALIIVYSILGVCLGILTLIYGSTTVIKSTFVLVSRNGLIPAVGLTGGLSVLLFIVLASVSGLTINTLFALGEEIGWRGFLYRVFYDRVGYVASSIIIGFIWGLWHAPLVAMLNYDFTLPAYYSPAPLTHVLLFCLFTTSLTFIMLRVRELSGSVASTAFIHGTFNAVAGVGLLASSLLPEYLRFPAGLLGATSSAVVAVCLNIIIKLRGRGKQQALNQREID